MAEPTDQVQSQDASKSTDLIKQVKNELRKSQLDGIKAKVKDLLKTRGEHEKSIAQLDVEVSKLISDFENGIS